MKRRTSGFTLIELLIVVVIIAILVAVVIPQLFGTKDKAFVASMRSDLRNLQTSEEAYFSDWQVYTSNLSDLGRMFITSPNVTVTIDSATATGWGANAAHAASTKTCTIAVSVQHAGSPTCP
jgi:prepilin-type N-terminal cleavage/methylation domain-containing protein